MATLPTNDELLDEFERDMLLDRTDIQMEIYRTLQLQAKWMRYYSRYKAAMIRAETILNQKVRDAYQYYDGSAESKVYRERGAFQLDLKNQQQRAIFLDADEDCNSYREKSDTAALNLKVCEEMLENLRYRPKHLETVFNVRQFEAG